jgi:hypothetical protein
MQYYPQALIVALLAAAVLVLMDAHQTMADAGGPIIPLPDTDRAQLDRLLGMGVVGKALPSAPLAGMAAYLSPKDRVMTLCVVTSDGKATTEAHRIEETADAAFAPGWHYTIEGIAELYFQKDAAGNIRTVAEKDLDKAVLSRFTPGDPLIVPGLKPGQSIKSKHKVEVFDLSNLKEVAHSGSLNVTYTYVGVYRVTVPSGTYNAALIRWDYTGEVGPATIKDSQYRFLANGAGEVAMIQIRSISALLIYSDHRKRGKLLVRTQ